MRSGSGVASGRGGKALVGPARLWCFIYCIEMEGG
jgi:hypothetical protein